MAEETKGGNDAVGRASIWALVLVGGFFFVQTYLAACVVPWQGAATFADIDSAFYDVALVAGGVKLMWICAIATGLAWGIADCMVAQAAISRILYAMSRDGFLPKSLSKVHSKFKTPYIATLFIAVLSLLITLVFTQGIQDLAELINFGALSAFVVLNFTVIYYFIYKKKSTKYFKHLVLPLMGLIVISIVWASLSRKAMILGIIWVIIGILIYIFLKKFKHKELHLDV